MQYELPKCDVCLESIYCRPVTDQSTKRRGHLDCLFQGQAATVFCGVFHKKLCSYPDLTLTPNADTEQYTDCECVSDFFFRVEH